MTWWGTPTRPTADLVTEIGYMKGQFDLKRRVKIESHVSWDVDFYIETLERELNSEDPRRLYWIISFRMHTDPTQPRSKAHSSKVFTLKIEYPSDYPHREPTVTLESHDTSGSPHMLLGGGRRLCLYDHSGPRSRGWDPSKSTGATFGLWAIQWIRAWIVWNRTGDWPEEA